VVAPLADAAGETLHHHAGFRFALFPRRGGHWPPLDDPDTLLRLGRFLGRLHAVGATRPFAHRPGLEVEGYAGEALRFLLAHDFVTPALRGEYQRWAEQVLAQCREAFTRAGQIATLRLHGDCHPGNILWTDAGGHLVDLDDCRSGPAIQDLWMLLSGERPQMVAQLSELLEGYEEFHDFDRRELALIEPLRAMRMLYYSGWLARRWEDPAFPMNFPWFGNERYWEEQILALREQSQRLEEAPLKLF
jgi:Ser/Thr protein kinase RdoA (MazF antagonist)